MHKSKIPDETGVVEALWEKVPYTYVNSSQTQGSNWDVRIVFSERVGSKIELRLGVVMSHQHAKAFYVALGSTIDKAEQLAGTQSSTTDQDAVQKMADER